MPTRPAAAAPVHVALLRGVNVGGKNKLPMKALAALFEEAGGTGVQTYIQSGNVLYRAGAAVARRVPERVAAAIAREHGLTVPVVTRSLAELRDVVAGNPFLGAGTDPKLLHVALLADSPTPAQVASLDPARSPPDELAVRGREVYLKLPNGVARTKITNAYLDSRLGTTSTVRNWNTVCKLLELGEAL